MTYSCMREAHYHRRGCVSLPSSGWDRVVPQRYVHQGEGGGSPGKLMLAHTLSLGRDVTSFGATVSNVLLRRRFLESLHMEVQALQQGRWRNNLRLYDQAARIISISKLNGLHRLHT